VASIQVIQGPDKGRRFELGKGENVLGRQSRRIPLTDGTTSRRHAVITFTDAKWVLTDLGSANGTYLNGVRLKAPTPLKLGDQIRIGSSLLVFSGGQPAADAGVDLDEDGLLVDAAIVATVPSNEDSVIIPTPEAGARAIDNLRILYDLIGEVGSIFDVDVLLQHTLARVLKVIKADRGYILLIGEDGELKLKTSRINTGDDRDVPISHTIIREVMKKEVGVLSSNAMSDKRFAAGKSVQNFGIRSAICVPIKGREGVLGVIHLDSSVFEQTYSTEQLRLLTAIGYQTGLAIDNVSLHQAAVQSERLAAVGETVAFLSHHIKNILQAMSAGADVVEMGLQAGDVNKAASAWPIVQRNLGRINGLILNMLAFSKSREPALENVNLNHVIGECVELQMPHADERNVALICELDDLPPISADSAGMHQAVLNLVTNALDAVEDGAGVVTVSSKYDSMNRNVIVRVADNGSGIEADRLEQIFTPFFSSKGHRGTGLGLAVTKKVVEEHHGRIEVASEPGKGTTFTITLPACTAGDSGETHGPAK